MTKLFNVLKISQKTSSDKLYVYHQSNPSQAKILYFFSAALTFKYLKAIHSSILQIPVYLYI